MKKTILSILLAMALVTGCSKSAETVSLESAADIPDRITMETILQEETTVSQTESSMESVTKTEYSETKDTFASNKKETRNTTTDTFEIEESEPQEEETEAETIEEFDDSISETCSHNFEFSDTYIEELEDDTWKDLYICPKCGAGYSVPHVFEEEVSEETNCSHGMIVDGVCQECGMDGLAELEDEDYEN